jgi:DNA-binding response OmpR family regulator
VHFAHREELRTEISATFARERLAVDLAAGGLEGTWPPCWWETTSVRARRTGFRNICETPLSLPVPRRPTSFMLASRMRVEARRGDVLVVEDEPAIGEVVVRYLERAGYRPRLASDGQAALAAVAADPPDLMILDLMLPRVDGLEVMRRVRESQHRRVAIILLTAKVDELDRVIGLRLGADDYLVKPFFPAELVARVDAVLRRVDTAAQQSVLDFEGLHIDVTGRRVIRDGVELALTQLEFDLLVYLARHPGQVFTRDQLMEAVWQYTFYTDTATVTVHVRRLRTKVERDPSAPRWLETIRGVGYRFSP